MSWPNRHIFTIITTSWPNAAGQRLLSQRKNNAVTASVLSVALQALRNKIALCNVPGRDCTVLEGAKHQTAS